MISPISDPNTFRCAPYVIDLIPRGKIVSSFLFFGGTLEFNLAQSGRFVMAHTNKYVVYEFWKCVQESGSDIIGGVKFLREQFRNSPRLLYYVQKKWPTYDNAILRSALFFLLNSYSKDNLISSGALDEENFSVRRLQRLAQVPRLENFHLELYGSEDILEGTGEKTKDADYVLFPIGKFSYNFFEEGKSVGYETSRVDHEKMRQFLKESGKRTLLLYKFHKALPSFYKGLSLKYFDSRGRPTLNSDEAKEVIVANFRIN